MTADQLRKFKICAEALGAKDTMLLHDRLLARFERQNGASTVEFNPLDSADQAEELEDWLLERGVISIDKTGLWFHEQGLRPNFDMATFVKLDDMTKAANRRAALVDAVCKVVKEGT